MKNIEVLVLEGCPHVDLALERARAGIVIARVPAELSVSYVESKEAAARLRFLGSPTVRVDGVDVDPWPAQNETFGLRCRVYEVDGHLEGAPPASAIAAALLASAHEPASARAS